MSEKIKPALTAEEWEKFGVAEQVIWEVQIIGKEGVWEPDSHAIGALALYGQPFGFSHADVAFLRSEPDPHVHQSDYDRIADLADRIESLLPPEKEGS